MPLELIEAILDYLDVPNLRRTLRTARFLRYPSEQRLYHRVTFPTYSTSDPGNVQARFLDTILKNDRLAQYVIKLVLGAITPREGGNAKVNRILGQAMNKMINLKQLDIYGNPYIAHAHLDSVPFSLTHLVISTQVMSDLEPVPGLLPILQAHPDLEELALDCSDFPDDLVSTLKEGHKGLVSEESEPILCPNLKRFDGYDEGLRLFLPMRKIESSTTMGPGLYYTDDDGNIDLVGWLNPLLIQSYQHLRVLEIWPKREGNIVVCCLPTIAPYLTSLKHLQIVDDIRALVNQSDSDHILSSLARIPTLESITLSSLGVDSGIAMMDIRDAVRHVCSALPDIPQVFVGVEEGSKLLFYRYVRGEGIQTDLVGQDVACRPYTRWLQEG